MSVWILCATVGVLACLSFFLGRGRALASVEGHPADLHSLPGYYGWYTALWCGLPGAAVLVLWLSLSGPVLEWLTLAPLPAEAVGQNSAEVDLFFNEVKNSALGGITRGVENPWLERAAERYRALRRTGIDLAVAVAALLSLAGAGWGLRRIHADLPARVLVESLLGRTLLLSSTLAILVTVGIVLSLVFETFRFLQQVPFYEFLFGIHWSPQTALRADQVASSGSFGAVPVFTGTLLVTLIAMAVAVPIGLMSAIYMTFYVGDTFRAVFKPILEVLAGVPTVVYGFFASLIVAPTVSSLGGAVGLDVASESALAAGLVMGIMIIPFISSLSDDAITAVPQSLRDGSYALGATRSETIRLVILPGALPGIVGAFLLAISRAIGETMIVVMAAGLSANLTWKPWKAVTTVTVQIVSLLTGDQEFDSAKTLSAFALGLVLFMVTLALNVLALRIVNKYRERYD